MKKPGTNNHKQKSHSLSKTDTKIPVEKKLVTQNKNTTSWGGVADWYVDTVHKQGSYQTEVIEPNLLRVVGKIKDKEVLDLACGEGYFSRSLQKTGARVLGVDIAPELIARAKKQSVESIVFKVTKSSDLSICKDNSFDVVICILALQNIENLKETFGEVSRVLRAGGRFVFVINHPAFRNPKESDWYYDESKKSQGRVVYKYMSEARVKIDMTPGEKNEKKKKYTYSFHRPLQSFVKELSKNGLAVTSLEEWISHKKSQQGGRSVEEDSARHEIPLFMCIEAKKL